MKAFTLKTASDRKGSALLIILAFVLLLTIITTAFLSKAMLARTVSAASSDQTRSDVFAAGAVDAILSDCQQEIAAGSTITTKTLGATQVTIYTPASAQNIVPSRTWQSAAITQPNPLPTLLKRSACALTFYPTGSMPGNANYPNATAYPPSEKTFAAVDPNVSTSAASLNGRSYPAVRWNQALLLPKKDLTTSNYTDYTPNANFTVPDWILVQRDGTNPTAWTTASLTTAARGDVTTTNKNPVVGRYAYAIYDEGSTLDMNVAGFPSRAYPSNAFIQKFYRTSLATVDLLQLLPSIGGTPFFTQTDIDSLVGWRNGATLQVTGTSPTYTFPLVAAENYFLNVFPPGTAFLHTTIANVPTTPTVLPNGLSDRKFTSRQQLISLLLNNIAQGNTEKANLQNALQYLGTFSRDLNQPTYQPDPNRPRMLAGTAADPASNGGNASATDDASNNINVPFTTTLVQTAFTRNDGSAANVGDSLVKKRFALNRLAWLTYAGPIADDSGNYNSAAGISNLVSTLKTSYGFTDAFLQQGGPTNIKNYFGLQWQQDPNDDNPTKRKKWFYNVHNNSAGAGKGIIRVLGGATGLAATNPHDPDFFELLKASILAGSKGKTLTSVTNITAVNSAHTPTPIVTNPTDPNYTQTLTDSSFDYQVLQIGANIIDQSRLDAYTTQIVFDNGNGPFEIRGVENFPYLYRLRTGALKLRNERGAVADDADKTTVPDNQVKYPNNATPTGFNDTGVAAFMQIPEIWNPHDVNSPKDGLAGAAFPSQFRIVVDSVTPAALATQGTAAPVYSAVSVRGYDNIANAPLNNIYSDTAAAANIMPYTLGPAGAGGTVSGGYNGESIQLNAKNTALTFTVPSTAGSTLYREPTMLSRPNLPVGSNLATAWSTPPADWTSVSNTAGTTCYTAGQGFISDLPNPLALAAAPGANQKYLGIVLGLYPVQWIVPQGAASAANNYIYWSATASASSSLGYGLTYRMQYTDPIQGGWVTYDEKYISPDYYFGATPPANSTAGNLVMLSSAPFGSGNWQSFADPRTSRFGTPNGDNDNFTYLAAPGAFPWKASPDWVNAANGVLVTDRPDYNQGFIIESSRGTFTLSSTFAPGWIVSNRFRWGPVSQNTIPKTSQAFLRYAGDTAATSPYQPFYYSDADGVVRRAMGGEVSDNNGTPPLFNYGYPMATANPAAGANARQNQSRPYLLKRPFRTVGELGYVFSGTPWKNLDFSNPESGDSALLDVFCISDTDDPNGLVAGRVNLNTQQVPVLAAILAEANYDDVAAKFNSPANGAWIGSSNSADPAVGSTTIYTNAPFHLSNWLVTGPETTLGTLGTTGTSATPLLNARELVGKWVGPGQGAGTMGIDGALTSNYAGFSNDISNFYDPTGSMAKSYFYGYDTRFREAAMRALSSVGETRVWNLMIDVVAQTGRYPSTATNASNFLVEGERRYWVHVAIDRYTGNILDRQIEEVRQ